MSAPLPTLRREREARLVELLDATADHLMDGAPNLAFADLTHAVQVLLGVEEGSRVSPEVKARLDWIIQLGGGIR